MARYGLVNGQIVQYSAEEESAADSEEITIAAEDAAIKYINERKNPYLKIQQIPVKLGDEFAIYGYPESYLNGYSINRTAGEVASLTGLRDDRTRFRIDAVIHGGNSGGPVVSKNSLEVTGIATESSTKNDVNNYAVKVSEIFDEIIDYLPVEDHQVTDHQTEDSVVQLFCGREIVDEPDDAYSDWSFEEMCKHYESADSSEKWEIFNACRIRGWPNPY